LTEIAGHIAFAADLAKRCEVGSELLDAEVERVTDVNAAVAADGNVGGEVELPQCGTARTHARQ
jgi:hypothetical protein